MTVQELREIINVYGILSLSNTYKLYQNDSGHHSYGNLSVYTDMVMLFINVQM